MQLAALAKLAGTNSAPALATLAHLIGDLGDDNRINASYDPGESPASYSDFANGWVTALEQLSQTYGTSELQSWISHMQSPDVTPFGNTGSEGNDGTDGGNIPEPGTITTRIDGTAYTFSQIGVNHTAGLLTVSAILSINDFVLLDMQMQLNEPRSGPLHCTYGSDSISDSHIKLAGVNEAYSDRLMAPFYGTYLATVGVGNCTIDITGTGASTTGTFSATLIKGTESITVSDGAFNIIMPSHGDQFP